MHTTSAGAPKTFTRAGAALTRLSVLQVEWEGAAESPEERKQQLEDSPQGVVSAVLRCELISSWCSIHVIHSCQVAACMRSGLPYANSSCHSRWWQPGLQQCCTGRLLATDVV